MEARTVKLYSLGYGEMKSYLVAALFAIGNILSPQMFHLIHQGGMIWLPIYFFTLVGAYKYGWRVGLLVAVLSPLANSALFSMPAPAVLPAIIMKSVLLALAAGFASARYRKATLLLLALVVLCYQTAGTLGEWVMTGSLLAAAQDFRIGIPGMLLQVFGGWVFINRIIRR